MKFKIKYAMGGSFGGLDNVGWEEIEADNMEAAEKYAYEMANENYEMYAGMYGVVSWGELKEENADVDDSYIDDLYNEEIESWIVMEVEEV